MNAALFGKYGDNLHKGRLPIVFSMKHKRMHFIPHNPTSFNRKVFPRCKPLVYSQGFGKNRSHKMMKEAYWYAATKEG